MQRLFAAVVVLGLAVAPALVPAGPARAAATERWIKDVGGAWFAWSSPVLADVNGDGANDVVVGGQGGGGAVHVFDANGNPLPGWPATALAPVTSSPAVGDLDGDGANEVVVGAGSLDVGDRRGGLSVFNRDGKRRCDVLTDTRHGTGAGSTSVFNAPALGDVNGDGRNDIVFGAFDHWIYAVDANCRILDRFDNKDSVWSAPALRDMDGIAGVEIFIGGDATAGGETHSGGYFRSLTWNGAKLVQRWVRQSEETFQSAGAIGDVNGDGRLEVVTGSGSDYCRNQNRCSADSRRVWAFHLDDGSNTPGWPRDGTYNGHFLAAPALGDIDGDGKTDVVLGSINYVSATKSFDAAALDAHLGNGRRWSYRPPIDKELLSPPVIADIDGAGSPEVVVAFDGQFHVLNGAGQVVQSRLGMGRDGRPLVHPNAAAVGELGAGRWAIVTAGFDPGDGRRGYVHAYDIPRPAATPWGQFRKNAARLGADPGPPGAPRGTAPPVVPTTVTTGPRPAPTTTRPVPSTSPPPPPPPETTTTTATLAPETTTTTAPSTTTTEPAEEDATGGGGAGIILGVLGLAGAAVFAWRRRRR